MLKTYVLSSSEMRRYCDATVKYLLAHLTVRTLESQTVAGWHNFFHPDRLGSTGTAIPLLFLQQLGAETDQHDRITQHLCNSQSRDPGRNEGGWAILSVAATASVEGTVWPMLALARSGDRRHRQAVDLAESWLLRQQHTSGGWGSYSENLPRTLLSASVIEGMIALSAPDRSAVSKAKHWMLRNQRPDGSWGTVPGEDGTVVHTAFALHALLMIGMHPTDPSLGKALNFIERKWAPNYLNFQGEIYDLHFGAEYARVSLEHDVDAAVIRVLLRTRPAWCMERVAEALGQVLGQFNQTRSISPANVLPSIWNIVPRAIAIHESLLLASPSDPCSIIVLGSSTVIDFQTRAPSAMIGNLAFHHAIQLGFKHFPLLIAVVASAIALGMLFTHSISDKDFFLAIIFPLSLLGFQFYWSRRSNP